MTGITSSGGKRLVLVSGRAHPELAAQVAEELGTELLPVTAYDFANGEIYFRFNESVRGADVFILQSHTDPINTWLMEQLIMADAAKRASAKRISVIAPFYPYARQDKKHRGREPIRGMPSSTAADSCASGAGRLSCGTVLRTSSSYRFCAVAACHSATSR